MTTHNPQSAERFSRGACAEFAIGLSHEFGYKLGVLEMVDEDNFPEGMLHVFAYHPTKPTLIIDARGIRAKSELQLPPIDAGMTLREETYDAEEIEAMFVHGRDGQKNIVDALTYIRESKPQYAV